MGGAQVKDLLNDQLRKEIDEIADWYQNACFDIAASCEAMGEGPMTPDDAYNDADAVADTCGDRLADVMVKHKKYDDDRAWNQAVKYFCLGSMAHVRGLERRLRRTKKRS
jgi:hypothetical protein